MTNIDLGHSTVDGAASRPSPLGGLVHYRPNGLVLATSAALLVAAVLVSTTGLVGNPFMEFRPYLPLLVGALGELWLLLFLFSRPPRGEVVAVLVAGAVGYAAHGWTAAVLLPANLQAPSVIHLTAGLPGLFAAGCLLRRYVRAFERQGPSSPETIRLAGLLCGCAFIAMFAMYAVTALKITAVLHPQTLDARALLVDHQFGFDATVLVAGTVSGDPVLHAVVFELYQKLPLIFPLLYGLQLLSGRPQLINFFWVWVVLTLVSLVGYHLFPITGPQFWMGADFFDRPLPKPSVEAVLVGLAPRNGMPSMHFGWALAVWAMSRQLGHRWAEWFFGLYAAAMVVATLGLGEHYLVDIVVAVPVVSAVLALCSWDSAWAWRERRWLVAAGFGLYGAWIIGMRAGIAFMTAHAWPVWSLTILSIASGIVSVGRLDAAARRYRERLGADAVRPTAAGAIRWLPPRPLTATQRHWRQVWALYLLSGVAGAVHATLLCRILAQAFGGFESTGLALAGACLSLAAIGAWVAGGLLRHRVGHMAIFAACQIVLGAFGLSASGAVWAAQAAWVQAAGATGATLAWALALGAAVLAVPALATGAGVPVVADYLCRRHQVPARRVLGSLFGAFAFGGGVATFVLMHVALSLVSMTNVLQLAGATSLLGGFAALRVRARARALRVDEDEAGDAGEAAGANAPATGGRGARLLSVGAGAALLAGTGVAATRLLAVCVGEDARLGATLVASLLLGFAIGCRLTEIAPPAWRATPRRLGSAALLLLALVLAIGALQWDAMPAYLGGFVGFPFPREYGAFQAVREALCLVSLLPAATLLGVFVAEAAGSAVRPAQAPVLGRAAAAVFAGAALGVAAAATLASAGVTWPALLRVAAWVSVGGAIVVAGRRHMRDPRLIVLAAAGLTALWLVPADVNIGRVASGAGWYLAPTHRDELIDQAWTLDGGLVTVTQDIRAGQVVSTLAHDGIAIAVDDPYGAMGVDRAAALAPLLHQAARGRALVVGYGSGLSTRMLKAAEFSEVDVIDTSADLVRLADRHFTDAGNASHLPGVSVRIADARDTLLTSSRGYDLIEVSMGVPWTSLSARVYQQEFYRAARSRLSAAGVLAQRVRLAQLRTEDLLRMVGTMRSVFPRIWLYAWGQEALLVGGGSDAAPSQAQPMLRAPALPALAGASESSAYKLVCALVLDPAGVDALLQSTGAPLEEWVARDDDMSIELGVVRGQVLDAQESFKANRRLMARFEPKTCPAPQP
jgi:spermidine synthase